MAKANQQPTVDVQAGLAALDADIPRVLRALDAASLESLGWSRPSKLSLLLPMSGTFQDVTDDYVLRLGFEAYRTWPPSAQFVNPQSLGYIWPQDQPVVPKLVSPECQTHPAYERPGGGKIQLVCCSATLEFYEVMHSVDPHHVWSEDSSFLATIVAIQKAFSSAYQGRFPPHGK